MGLEALDRRDGAAVTFVCLQPGVARQMAVDQVLQHLQHRCDRLGLRGQQQARRDRLQRISTIVDAHFRLIVDGQKCCRGHRRGGARELV